MPQPPATISVAVPTVGRTHLLRRCLGSVLAAGGEPHELIVVDQSGDGEVAELLDSLGELRLRRVAHRPPSAAAARNRAVLEASGDYVAFLDDDEEVPSGWLVRVAQAIERYGRPDAIFGEIRSGHPSDRKGLEVSTFSVREPRVWLERADPAKVGFSGHLVVRRSAFQTLGGFDERLGPGTSLRSAEDMDFAFRLLGGGRRVVSTPELWVIHHHWRAPEELPRHFFAYNIGEGAYLAKHMLRRDPLAGRLLLRHLREDLKMFASALRRRSALRARVACWRVAGTWYGLALGLRTYRTGRQ